MKGKDEKSLKIEPSSYTPKLYLLKSEDGVQVLYWL